MIMTMTMRIHVCSGLIGTSAEFWLGMQTDYDMAKARISMGDVLARIVRREERQLG